MLACFYGPKLLASGFDVREYGRAISREVAGVGIAPPFMSLLEGKAWRGVPG